MNGPFISGAALHLARVLAFTGQFDKKCFCAETEIRAEQGRLSCALCDAPIVRRKEPRK